MTCTHGTSEVAALPIPFKDDEELRIYCGLPNTEEGRAILAKIDDEERASLAAMRAVENELKAGRIPKGVIACDRKRRR